MMREMINKITESTPITIALTIAVTGGAMFVGMAFENLRTRVGHNEAEHIRHDAWQVSMSKLTREMSELSRDNKARIDLWEQRKIPMTN